MSTYDSFDQPDETLAPPPELLESPEEPQDPQVISFDDLPSASLGAHPEKTLMNEARRYGLRLSSGKRTRSQNAKIPHASPTSEHLTGSGWDFVGAPNKMRDFTNYLHRAYGDQLDELYHDPVGGWKNGQDIGPIGHHANHVHVGAMPIMGFDDLPDVAAPAAPAPAAPVAPAPRGPTPQYVGGTAVPTPKYKTARRFDLEEQFKAAREVGDKGKMAAIGAQVKPLGYEVGATDGWTYIKPPAPRSKADAYTQKADELEQEVADRYPQLQRTQELLAKERNRGIGRISDVDPEALAGYEKQISATNQGLQALSLQAKRLRLEAAGVKQPGPTPLEDMMTRQQALYEGSQKQPKFQGTALPTDLKKFSDETERLKSLVTAARQTVGQLAGPRKNADARAAISDFLFGGPDPNRLRGDYDEAVNNLQDQVAAREATLARATKERATGQPQPLSLTEMKPFIKAAGMPYTPGPLMKPHLSAVGQGLSTAMRYTNVLGTLGGLMAFAGEQAKALPGMEKAKFITDIADYISDVPERMQRTIADMFLADTARGIGAMASLSGLPDWIGYGMVQTGEDLEAAVKAGTPHVDEKATDKFRTIIVPAVASSIGMLMAGGLTANMIGPLEGLIGKEGVQSLSIMLSSGLTNAGQTFADAVKAGATPEQQAFMAAIGVYAGMSEAAGIPEMFAHLGEGTFLKRLIKGGFKESPEEMIQEAGQNLLTQMGQKLTYKPQQELGEGIGDAILGAAAASLLFAGGTALVSRPAKPGTALVPRPSTLPAAPALPPSGPGGPAAAPVAPTRLALAAPVSPEQENAEREQYTRPLHPAERQIVQSLPAGMPPLSLEELHAYMQGQGLIPMRPTETEAGFDVTGENFPAQQPERVTPPAPEQGFQVTGENFPATQPEREGHLAFQPSTEPTPPTPQPKTVFVRNAEGQLVPHVLDQYPGEQGIRVINPAKQPGERGHTRTLDRNSPDVIIPKEQGRVVYSTDGVTFGEPLEVMRETRGGESFVVRGENGIQRTVSAKLTTTERPEERHSTRIADRGMAERRLAQLQAQNPGVTGRVEDVGGGYHRVFWRNPNEITPRVTAKAPRIPAAGRQAAPQVQTAPVPATPVEQRTRPEPVAAPPATGHRLTEPLMPKPKPVAAPAVAPKEVHEAELPEVGQQPAQATAQAAPAGPKVSPTPEAKTAEGAGRVATTVPVGEPQSHVVTELESQLKEAQAQVKKLAGFAENEPATSRTHAMLAEAQAKADTIKASLLAAKKAMAKPTAGTKGAGVETTEAAKRVKPTKPRLIPTPEPTVKGTAAIEAVVRERPANGYTPDDIPALSKRLTAAGVSLKQQVDALNRAGFNFTKPDQVFATVRAFEMQARGERVPELTHKKFGKVLLIGVIPAEHKMLVLQVSNGDSHWIQTPTVTTKTGTAVKKKGLIVGLLGNTWASGFNAAEIAALPDVSKELGVELGRFPSKQAVQTIGQYLGQPWGDIADVPINVVKALADEGIWVDYYNTLMDLGLAEPTPEAAEHARRVAENVELGGRDDDNPLIMKWRKETQSKPSPNFLADPVKSPKVLAVLLYDGFRTGQDLTDITKRAISMYGESVRPYVPKLWGSFNGSNPGLSGTQKETPLGKLLTHMSQTVRDDQHEQALYQIEKSKIKSLKAFQKRMRGIYGNKVSSARVTQIWNEVQSYINPTRLTGAEVADAQRTLDALRSRGEEMKAGVPTSITSAEGKTPAQALALQRRRWILATRVGENSRFWYDRSSQAVLDMFGGDKVNAEKFVQLLAIFSPKNGVQNNFTMALRAWHQRLNNEEIKAGGMGALNDKATELLYKGISWEGRKTNNFYLNLMTRIDPSVLPPDAAAMAGIDRGQAADRAVTVDVHMMRAFGFNETEEHSPTDARHDFVTAEINRVAKEFGWKPPEVQAAMWTAKRAADTLSDLRENKPEQKKQKTPAQLLQGARTPISALTVNDIDFKSAMENVLGRISVGLAPRVGLPGYAAPGPGISAQTHQRRQEAYRQARLAAIEPHVMALMKEAGLPYGYLTALPGAANGVATPEVQLVVPIAFMQKTKSVPGQKRGVDIPGARNRVDPAQVRWLDGMASWLGATLNLPDASWAHPFYDAQVGKANTINMEVGRGLTPAEAIQLDAALTEQLGPGYAFARPTEEGAWIRRVGGRLEQQGLIDRLNQLERSEPKTLSLKEKRELASLQKTRQQDNIDFHKKVAAAMESLPWEDSIKIGRIATDGNVIPNDRRKNGESYRRRFTATGSPGIFQRHLDRSRAAVAAVDADFAERFGWGKEDRFSARVTGQDVAKERPIKRFGETEGWLLKPPSATLTKAEQEWFDWAEEGAKEVLNDPDWLRDNDDALTTAGQIEDMRYRLEDQAQDVAETDATAEQLRGRKRTISSLLKKLEDSGYFDEGAHEPIKQLMQGYPSGKIDQSDVDAADTHRAVSIRPQRPGQAPRAYLNNAAGRILGTALGLQKAEGLSLNRNQMLDLARRLKYAAKTFGLGQDHPIVELGESVQKAYDNGGVAYDFFSPKPTATLTDIKGIIRHETAHSAMEIVERADGVRDEVAHGRVSRFTNELFGLGLDHGDLSPAQKAARKFSQILEAKGYEFTPISHAMEVIGHLGGGHRQLASPNAPGPKYRLTFDEQTDLAYHVARTLRDIYGDRAESVLKRAALEVRTINRSVYEEARRKGASVPATTGRLRRNQAHPVRAAGARGAAANVANAGVGGELSQNPPSVGQGKRGGPRGAKKAGEQLELPFLLRSQDFTKELRGAEARVKELEEMVENPSPDVSDEELQDVREHLDGARSILRFQQERAKYAEQRQQQFQNNLGRLTSDEHQMLDDAVGEMADALAPFQNNYYTAEEGRRVVRDAISEKDPVGALKRLAYVSVPEGGVRGTAHEGGQLIRLGKIAPEVEAALDYLQDAIRPLQGPGEILRQSKEFSEGKQPWEMSQKEYLANQKTGHIDSEVYKDYESQEKIAEFIKREHYKKHVANITLGGTQVEIRESGEPLQYVKYAPRTFTHEGESWVSEDIARDENGMALYLSPEEMKEKGIPAFGTDLAAFVDGKPIGWVSNEFGSIGAWVLPEYQRRGLGTYLVTEFRERTPRIKKLGQMTPAGVNLTNAYHESLVRDAVAEGKPVPQAVLADYPELQAQSEHFLSKENQGTLQIGPATEDKTLRQMRVAEGKAAAGGSSRLYGVMAMNMYPGNVAQVNVKEGIQNAVDGVRAITQEGHRGYVSVDVDTNKRTISIEDNGVGMSPKVAGDEFLDPGETFKPGPKSSGGYGIAKVAILGNAQEVDVITRWRNPEVGERYHDPKYAPGTVIQTTVTGGKGDIPAYVMWGDKSIALDIASRDVGPESGTGTSLVLHVREADSEEEKNRLDFDEDDLRDQMAAFLLNSKLPYEFNFAVDGSEIDPKKDINVYGHAGEGLEHDTHFVTSIDVPGAQIDIHAGDATSEHQSVRVTVLNNGLPQFAWYYKVAPGNNAVLAPDRIVIDVHATGRPEDANYPFAPNRESLQGEANAAIEKFMKRIGAAAADAERDLYESTLTKAPRILGTPRPIPFDEDTQPYNRRYVHDLTHRLVDTSGRLSREFVKELSRAPYAAKLSKGIEKAMDVLASKLSREDSAYTEVHYAGLGIGIEQGSSRWFGVNIPHSMIFERSGPDIVLMNPYVTAETVDRQVQMGIIEEKDATMQFARSLAATALHELTHRPERGHEVSFAGQLTRNIANTAGPAFNEAVQAIYKAVGKDYTVEGYVGSLRRQSTFQEILAHANKITEISESQPTGESIFSKIGTHATAGGESGSIPSGVSGREEEGAGRGVSREGGEGVGPAGVAETGKPYEFTFLRNTEKAGNFGERFGQHLEPAGRYMIEAAPGTTDHPKGWELGRARFESPLVLDWGASYQEPGNWKQVLSERFSGKTGKALSAALRKAGYDGIVTMRDGDTSEIVDLREKPVDITRGPAGVAERPIGETRAPRDPAQIIADAQDKAFHGQILSAEEKQALKDAGLTVPTYREPPQVGTLERETRRHLRDRAHFLSKENQAESIKEFKDFEDQTDTPEFQKFIEGTKVVDENGEPRVMYHVTNDDFTVFDTKGRRSESNEIGAHFGTQAQTNDLAESMVDRESRRGTGGTNTMPAYLSLKNPLRLVDNGSFKPDEVIPQLVDSGIFSEKEEDQLDKLLDKVYESTGIGGGVNSKINEKLRAMLAKKGYDGIVYLNRREGVNRDLMAAFMFGNRMSDADFQKRWPMAEDSYIAFQPEQVKSATGNRGTFASDNPNILQHKDFEEGGKVLPGEARFLRARLEGMSQEERDALELRYTYSLDRFLDEKHAEGDKRSLAKKKAEYVERFGPLVPIKIGNTSLTVGRSLLSDDQALQGEVGDAIDAIRQRETEAAKPTREAIEATAKDAPFGVYWHGSPSGNLKGSATGLHVGTYRAAQDALEARIGIPAEGVWDGSREYGKTLIAGLKTLRERGLSQTGYNARNVPEEDYYPTERELPTYSDKTPVSLTARPSLIPVRISGEMSNWPSSAHGDFKANALMKGQITRGTAKRGYYYENVSEDAGSVSAVVPSAAHLQVAPDVFKKTMGASRTSISQMIGVFKGDKLVGTASLTQDTDPTEWVKEHYGEGYEHGPLSMEIERNIELGGRHDDHPKILQFRLNTAKKTGQLNFGADPVDSLQRVMVLGYDAYRGLQDFREWSKKMLTDAGEAVRPILKDIWTQVQAFHGQGSASYSPLQKTIEAKMSAKMSPTELRKMLVGAVDPKTGQSKGGEGISKAEMVWTGMDTLLNERERQNMPIIKEGNWLDLFEKGGKYVKSVPGTFERSLDIFDGVPYTVKQAPTVMDQLAKNAITVKEVVAGEKSKVKWETLDDDNKRALGPLENQSAQAVRRATNPDGRQLYVVPPISFDEKEARLKELQKEHKALQKRNEALLAERRERTQKLMGAGERTIFAVDKELQHIGSLIGRNNVAQDRVRMASSNYRIMSELPSADLPPGVEIEETENRRDSPSKFTVAVPSELGVPANWRASERKDGKTLYVLNFYDAEQARERVIDAFNELRTLNIGQPIHDIETATGGVQHILGNRAEVMFDEPDYRTPGGTNYKEFRLSLPKEVEDGKRSYTSHHFPDPNLVVHTRTTDREIPASELASSHPELAQRLQAEGRDAKALHLEEVQSDYGQAARKKGIIRDTTGWTAMPLGRAVPAQGLMTDRAPQNATMRGVDRWQVNDADGNPVTTMVGGTAEDAIREAANVGVPNAPFIDNTEDWTMLALRGMTRYAAENGYDLITWSPASEQFKRWGSERIDWQRSLTTSNKIGSDPTGGYSLYDKAGVRLSGPYETKREAGEAAANFKTWSVKATEQHGGFAGGFNIEEEAERRGILKKGAEAISSKDDLRQLLIRVLQRERHQYSAANWTKHLDELVDKTWGRMQTEDSGTAMPRKEGFEGYYGRMFPNYAVKYGKKFGAKVAPVPLDTLQGFIDGETVMDLKGIPRDEQDSYWRNLTQEQRDAMFEEARKTRLSVSGMEITPEMQRSVTTEGQPIIGGEPRFLAEARARVRQAMVGNMQSANPFGLLKDLGLITGADVYKLTKKFSGWANQMIKRLGEGIKPHLASLYSQVRVISKEFWNDTAGAMTISRRPPKTAAGYTPVLDVISAVRKAGLLSSLKTHARNILGTGAFQGVEELARVPGSAADMMAGLVTGQRGLTGPSAGAVARAGYEAATRGLSEAWQIMKQGTPTNNQAQVYAEMDTGFPILDMAVNLTFRSLSAEDRVQRVYAAHRALEGRAKAMALTERKQGTLTQSVADRTADIVQNPSPTLWLECLGDAEMATFNNSNILSSATAQFRASLRRSGALGRAGEFGLDMIVPFDRTPTNILARLLEYTPGGVIVGGTRLAARTAAMKIAGKAFSADEQLRFARTFGRGVTGSALIALGWALYMAGRAMPLYDDDDKKRRQNRANKEAGRSPMSVKIDNHWFTIGSFSPLGNMIAIGATLAEADESGEKGYGAALKGVAKSLIKPSSLKTFGEVSMEQPLFRSSADLYEAMRKPEGKAGNFLGRLAGSFVPASGMARDVAMATDTKARKTFGFMGQATGGIPYLRNKLPEDVGVQHHRYWAIDPFRTTTEMGATMSKEMINKRVIDAVRGGDLPKARAAWKEGAEAGVVAPNDEAGMDRLVDKAQLPPLQFAVKYKMTLEQALEKFNEEGLSPADRKGIGPYVAKKIDGFDADKKADKVPKVRAARIQRLIDKAKTLGLVPAPPSTDEEDEEDKKP